MCQHYKHRFSFSFFLSMTLGSKIRSYYSHFMPKETEAQATASQLVRGGAFPPHTACCPSCACPKQGSFPRWSGASVCEGPLTRSIIAVIEVHLDRVAIVGKAEGCAGLIGKPQWLQAGRIHSLSGYDIDWRLAVSLGNGIQLVPL